MTDSPTPQPEEPKKPNLFQIASSIISAAFGVQSDQNRRRDFAGGSPLAFIVGGLVFTLIFVLSLIGIVMLVTH